MKIYAWLLLLCLSLAGGRALGQIGYDPLTPAEATQVQNTAGRPEKRIPLLLQFATDRITHFDQIRTDPAAPAGRDAQLYALLRQYAAILPELDDAVDELSQGVTTSETDVTKYNVPKTLAPIITGLQDLTASLKQIQTGSSASDLANYHFELDDCLDVTGDSLQNAIQDRDQAVQAAQAAAAAAAAAKAARKSLGH